MAGNSFGTLFRITTAGESHGPAQVLIVDGCPAGLPLDEQDIDQELSRRKPGGNPLASARREPDTCRILSGVYEGKTTGTSIAILIENQDARSQDYAALAQVYRPGHADWTYDQKYGRRDPRGGGRSSARETVTRVAAGAIAKKLLRTVCGLDIVGYVKQIGAIQGNIPHPEAVTSAAVEHLPDGSPNWVRCPDPEAARQMAAWIESVRAQGDSTGGVTEMVVHRVPAGLGEPVFDKLKADLAKALFGIPAVMGVEYGTGFASATLRGSQHNDLFHVNADGAVQTQTNRHGGMLGGISSGMPLILRTAVKAPSSIAQTQKSVDRHGQPISLQIPGRHDPCVLPRFIPIAEAMVALVLADHWLRARASSPVEL